MDVNSKEISVVISLKKNGFLTTLYYLFSYILIKFNLKDHIYYKKNKIYLRNNTTDFPIFREILFGMEYDLNYPAKVETIIDAGANIGLAAIYFAEKFPQSKIYAIEPDRENFALLCKNTKDLKNIIPVNKGLWSDKIELKLSDKAVDGASGICATPATETAENTIEGISMSDLIKEFGIDNIDVLKIDIEGAEAEVFSVNTENWLKKVCLLLVETHDRFKKGCAKSVFTALKSFNYSVETAGEKFVIKLDD